MSEADRLHTLMSELADAAQSSEPPQIDTLIKKARKRRQARRAAAAVAALTIVAAAVTAAIVVSGHTRHVVVTTSPPASTASLGKLGAVPLSALVAAADHVAALSQPQAIHQPPLTSGGKPEVLYLSAGFCPICAAEDWPLLVALSQFGTFTKVSETHSALADGDIATPWFYGSTYTSPYLTFVPVETTTNQPSGSYYKPLQTPTAAQIALWRANEPGGQEAFPFIYIAGKTELATSQVPVTVFNGHSFDDIADSIGSNQNTIGADVDAAALVLVKDLCAVTGQQPTSTCSVVS